MNSLSGRFLNKPLLIYFYTLKWFQVLLTLIVLFHTVKSFQALVCNTNTSI